MVASGLLTAFPSARKVLIPNKAIMDNGRSRVDNIITQESRRDVMKEVETCVA
jgi:hypothetical protein